MDLLGTFKAQRFIKEAKSHIGDLLICNYDSVTSGGFKGDPLWIRVIKEVKITRDSIQIICQGSPEWIFFDSPSYKAAKSLNTYYSLKNQKRELNNWGVYSIVKVSDYIDKRKCRNKTLACYYAQANVLENRVIDEYSKYTISDVSEFDYEAKSFTFIASRNIDGIKKSHLITVSSDTVILPDHLPDTERLKEYVKYSINSGKNCQLISKTIEEYVNEAQKLIGYWVNINGVPGQITRISADPVMIAVWAAVDGEESLPYYIDYGQLTNLNLFSVWEAISSKEHFTCLEFVPVEKIHLSKNELLIPAETYRQQAAKELTGRSFYWESPYNKMKITQILANDNNIEIMVNNTAMFFTSPYELQSEDKTLKEIIETHREFMGWADERKAEKSNKLTIKGKNFKLSVDKGNIEDFKQILQAILSKL